MPADTSCKRVILESVRKHMGTQKSRSGGSYEYKQYQLRLLDKKNTSLLKRQEKNAS